MATDKGYPVQQKEDRLTAEFVTVSPVTQFKHGLDVIDRSTVTVAASDAAEAGSTANSIVATGHAVLKGDRLRFTSGSFSSLEVDAVDIPDANTITIAQTLSSDVGIGDTFDILRPTSLTVGAGGGISVSAVPIQFLLDTVLTTVEEDTGTPSNNRPLPVKLMDLTGDITVTANNLNVQLTHTGANPDSVRIGDGVETVNVNVSNELQVADDTARTSLSTIAGDTTSLDGKLPAQGAAVIAASTPVNIASDQVVPISASALPLPTGAATEATLSSIDTDTTTIAGDTTSIDGKTPALGAAVIAASVPVNIASDQVVPISASSLPLPTGAATSALQTTGNTSLATIAGAVSGTEMQVDVVASLPAGTNNIGDVDIASALPTGTNTIGAVDLNRLDVVDLIDDLGDGSGIVFAANDNIDDSAGTFLTIVASTAAEIQAMQVIDTTGGYIGLFTGPGASEVLKAVIGPGSDQTVELNISAATRLSVRRMDSATVPLTAGFLSINFLG